MNSLQSWMQRTTTKQQQRLATLARTTIGNLRQIAGGYRTKGKASTTAELALRIDRASAVMKSREPDLPLIPRESLSAACSRCEFAKRCRKQ